MANRKAKEEVYKNNEFKRKTNGSRLLLNCALVQDIYEANLPIPQFFLKKEFETTLETIFKKSGRCPLNLKKLRLKLSAIIEKFKEIYPNEAAKLVSVDSLHRIFGKLVFEFIESNFFFSRTKIKIFFKGVFKKLDRNNENDKKL